MPVLELSSLRIILPAIAGFLFYGGWAVAVNSMHGWGSAVKAGLVQGSYSFIITLILTLLIEWLYRVLGELSFKRTLVFMMAMTILSVVSIGINWLAGTPEILWTVLPGLLISAVYTSLYLISIDKIGGNLPRE